VYGPAIERQRCLQVGLVAKQDQAEAIAAAALDEVAGDGLDGGQPRRRLAIDYHVFALHAAGNIHRQQQVTTADRQLQRFADELRARRGGYQQHPGQQRQHQAPGCWPLGTGRRRRAQCAVERQSQRGARWRADARQGRRQQRQRQGAQRPRPGKAEVHERPPELRTIQSRASANSACRAGGSGSRT
jgi:hypothetical protein